MYVMITWVLVHCKQSEQDRMFFIVVHLKFNEYESLWLAFETDYFWLFSIFFKTVEVV